MHLSLSEWPLTQEVGGAQKVPEEELIRWKFAGLVKIIEPVIQYEKYQGKSFQFAVNVTARILRIAKHKSFSLRPEVNNDGIVCLKQSSTGGHGETLRH